MIWITVESSTNFLFDTRSGSLLTRKFVIAFPPPKKIWQPPSGEFCRVSVEPLAKRFQGTRLFFFFVFWFVGWDVYLMMFGVVVDQLLFTKCLFVSFFWLNLRNSSIFLGAAWFVWWKMGTGNFKVSWGSPSYGTVLQMLRATCLPPRFPDRNERCWRENQDKGGGEDLWAGRYKEHGFRWGCAINSATERVDSSELWTVPNVET